MELPKRKPTLIVPEWQEYFEQFCRAHGDPMPFDGGGEVRLLFPDGWMYSSENYHGPEYPPPREQRELVALQVEYWTMRRTVVRIQLAEIRDYISRIEHTQQTRDLPLVVGVYQSDEYGMQELQEVRPLNVNPLKSQEKLLMEEIKQCDEMLNTLQTTSSLSGDDNG